MDNESSRNFYTTTAIQEEYENKVKSQNITPHVDFETGDYSTKSNFKEETGYDIKNKVQSFSEHEQETFSFFPIDIQRKSLKDQEQVSLIKTRQRFILGGRLKIVLSSFIVIMISLMVAIIWNFAQIAKLNSDLTEKEVTINELQKSISNKTDEYKLVDSEENTKKLAEASGYVQVTEENSKIISLGEMHTEATPTQIPSNWFNDVCNFLINVFNWWSSKLIRKKFCFSLEGLCQ